MTLFLITESSAAFGAKRTFRSQRESSDVYWFMLEPLIMSKQVFDGLSKNQQEIMMALGSEMEQFGTTEAMAANRTAGLAQPPDRGPSYRRPRSASHD